MYYLIIHFCIIYYYLILFKNSIFRARTSSRRLRMPFPLLVCCSFLKRLWETKKQAIFNPTSFKYVDNILPQNPVYFPIRNKLFSDAFYWINEFEWTFHIMFLLFSQYSTSKDFGLHELIGLNNLHELIWNS